MNNKRMNKMIATKRLYKNANTDSLTKDLESYKKALSSRNYKDSTLHVEEMKMIETELKRRGE